MTRIKRDDRRNTLGCSKDVLENADVPVQINSIPYPEDGCKMWKARGSINLKRISTRKKEGGVGKKSHEGKFSNCFIHR